MRARQNVSYRAALRHTGLHRRWSLLDRHALLSVYTTHALSDRTVHTHQKPGASRSCASSACSSSSSTPPPHLFESPAVRDIIYDFLPQNVILPSAAAWAEHTVDSLDHPRDKAFSFLDSVTSTCCLCGPFAHGGSRLHLAARNHMVRRAIVGRALGYLYTFCSQATRTVDEKHRSPRHQRPSGSGAVGAAAGPGITREMAAASSYHTSYARSPLFDEPGVPSGEELFHNRDALHKLDLVELLLRRWWRVLNQVPVEKGGYAFDRVVSLSSDVSETRGSRLRYLLFFLASRGVLRNSVQMSNVATSNTSDLQSCKPHRGPAFERVEMAGDLVFKTFVEDRMHAMFPADEGGVTLYMDEVRRVVDCNHGLLTVYDYLNLDDLRSQALANNKSKADIVEAIAGELQAQLWTMEVYYNTDAYPLPAERANARYLHAVVQHTLQELGHVALMWHIENTLRGAKAIIKGCLDKAFHLDENAAGQSYTDAAAVSTEFEKKALAKGSAQLPLMLPWRRPRGGTRSPKNLLALLADHRAERLRACFPDAVAKLACTPHEMPAEMRNRFAVHPPYAPLSYQQAQSEAVQSVLCAAPAHEFASGESPQSRGGCLFDVFMPDLQPQPHPRALEVPSAEAMRELHRVNCVVQRRTAPQLRTAGNASRCT